MTIRVLHIENDPARAELTAAFLERAGDFDVEAVETASEALDRLNQQHPDCVLSDYDMPSMNGIELLECVREEYPDLPFLLYTGKGSEEVASTAIAAGVTDYVKKGTGDEHYELLANRIENAVGRKRAEEDKEETETRYEELVDKIPHGVVIFQDDEIVYANQRAAEIVNLDSAEDLVGIHPAGYIDEENSNVMNRIEAVLEQGETIEGETRRLRTAEGNFRYVYYYATRVQYEGEPAIQIVTTDNTNKVESRDYLTRQSARQEQIIRTLSVDIRRPLATAIEKINETIEQGDIDHLSEVRESLEHMDAVVADVLDFARDGKPVNPDEIERLSVGEAARDAWENIECTEADLRVVDSETVEAVEGRVERLFECLFQNSVDHAGTGVTITVGSLDGGRKGFYVEDDGPGISEASEIEVFRRGFTTDEDGTGFGLAIAEQIAEVHGWRIELTDPSNARFEVLIGEDRRSIDPAEASRG